MNFAQDAEGNWGYIPAGADSVIPFKNGIDVSNATLVHSKKGSNTAFTSTYTASSEGYYLAIAFSAGNTSSNTTSISTTGDIIFNTSERPEDSGQTHITIMFVKLKSGDTVTGSEPNGTNAGRAAFVVWGFDT